MTAIAISPNSPLRNVSARTGSPASGGSVAGSLLDTTHGAVKTTQKLFIPGFLTIIGTFGTFMASVAADLLPDSFLDKFSKVIAAVCGIAGITGLVKGYHALKEIISPKDSEPTTIQPNNETFRKTTKDAEKKLKDSDANFGQEKQGLVSTLVSKKTDGSSNNELKDSAEALLNQYKDKSILDIISGHSGGPAPLIGGISGENLSIDALKDRTASLTAFSVSAGSTSATTIQADLKTKDSDLRKLLPEDFLNAFDVLSFYNENYSNPASLKSIVDAVKNDDIKNLLEDKAETPEKRNALIVLDNLQEAHNVLDVIQKMISLVLSKPDDTSRDIQTIRQALVTGFNITGSGEEINEKLREKLNGTATKTGINKKLEDVKNRLDSVATTINDSRFPFKKVASNKAVINSGLGSITLFEFKQSV